MTADTERAPRRAPSRIAVRRRLTTGTILAVVTVTGCGAEETLVTESAEAEVAAWSDSAPSRERYESRVVDYRNFDGWARYQADGCRHVVSKQVRGQWLTAGEEVQSGGSSGAETLKWSNEYRMEMEAGDSDSTVSRERLDGSVQGEFVAAFGGGTADGRGSLHGRFEWAGYGADVVGAHFSVINAGSHHSPLSDAERSEASNHAEGTMIGAVIEGLDGALLEGVLTFDFERYGTSAEFVGVFEGVLITACD